LDNDIKVLIVDDSSLIRTLLSKMLSTVKGINVVGTALNGAFALNKLHSLKPDVIVLDLEMPDMNGIDFLRERNKLGIKIPVIILSAHAKKGAKITLDALSLGASDFILKPSEAGQTIEDTKNKLVEMIYAIARPGSYIDVEASTNYIKKTTIEPPAYNKIDISSYIIPVSRIPEIDVVSIGISTGGPNALREVLPLIPEDFPVPIVIVQHMPAGFTLEFANSLNNICRLEVKEAADNDILKKGRIYIAPGNKHIYFEKRSLATVIRTSDEPQVNGHRPSAEVLFRSTAEVFGRNSLAVIMTGMGKDGAAAIGSIKDKGGVTIAQDQETAIVFGMPRVAIELRNINMVVPLGRIAEYINNLVMRRTIPR